jgi:tetratricopeptide (TPR) repeat protein
LSAPCSSQRKVPVPSRIFCSILLASIVAVPDVRGEETKKEDCTSANILLATKEFSAARKAYLEALSKTPDLQCAATGLQKSDALQKQDGLTRVRLLESLGLYEEALTALKDLAKKDPGVLTSIPDDLQYLSGGRIGLWRTLRREVEPLGRPLGEILALGALLGSCLVWSYLHWFKPPYMEIQEFEDKALGTELGKGFTALMNDALKRLATGAPGLRVGLVSGPIAPVSIPAELTQAIPSAISWVNFLPALLAKMSPRRSFSLGGQLHKAGELGAGVTMVLSENKNVISSLTIWQSQFDPSAQPTAEVEPKAYYTLSEPAAIWLLFELAEHSRAAA